MEERREKKVTSENHRSPPFDGDGDVDSLGEMKVAPAKVKKQKI